MRLAGRGLCIVVATISIAGCDVKNLLWPPKGANPEAPYAGERPDAPSREKRGNAEFTAAAFDDTGRLLVTQSHLGSARIQVWDAATGALIAGIDAIIPPGRSFGSGGVGSNSSQPLPGTYTSTQLWASDWRTI